jgi:hypothetical protein
MKVLRTLLAAATLTGSGLGSHRARADEKGVAQPAVVAPDPSRAEEAGVRFRRGVELYAEGDLSAALVEFTRAYQLVPRYKILYNIAQITYQQQDYVTTVRHFRRYLAEGGADVPPARAREVQQEIRRLEPRVGRLDVQVSVADARVLLDGTDVGGSPLASPIEANLGRRHLEVLLPSGERLSRFVDLAGGELVPVMFRPSPLRPNPPVAVRSGDDAALPVIWNDEVNNAARVRRTPWVAWSATAALAVGAGVVGALAVKSSQDLKHARDDYPAAPDDLNRLHERTRMLSLAADGALVVTVLMAGVSTYLTLRSDQPAPAVAFTPTGLRLRF